MPNMLDIANNTRSYTGDDFAAAPAEETIEHYGVIGMKWYQGKYGKKEGAKKYAKKGIDIAEKADAQATKARNKAEKQRTAAMKASTKANAIASKVLLKIPIVDNLRISYQNKKAAKNASKALKNEERAQKLVKKAQKTINKMDKLLAGTKVSDWDTNEKAVGQKYCSKLLDATLNSSSKRKASTNKRAG